MARVLVVPDVHGSHEWEVVKTYPKDSYDYIVFLGDYFDSWANKWPDQGENFLNICMFVAEDPKHRKMLLGNHDFSYISGTRKGSNCSGHQNSHIGEIKALLTENIDLIDLAFEIDGCVFSHAGFTNYWVSEMKHHFHIVYDEWPDDETGNPGKVWDDSEWSIEFLNKHWHRLTHTLGDDTFEYGFDELIDWHGFFSGSGNEITQGPTWVRPEALLKDAYYPRQVVGHTEYAVFSFENLHSEKADITLCDSRFHKVYGIIDTAVKPETKTLTEFYRWFKIFEKAVLDFKSVQYATMDYSKETIMPKIIEEFGKDRADVIYALYFEE